MTYQYSSNDHYLEHQKKARIDTGLTFMHNNTRENVDIIRMRSGRLLNTSSYRQSREKHTFSSDIHSYICTYSTLKGK